MGGGEMMDAALAYDTTEPTAQQVRVLIVDPHASFRYASTALLRAEGLAVVAEVESWEDAEDVASAVRPDVMLIDDSPWQTGGLDLARRMSMRAEPPAIVLMSASPAASVLATLAGADLFLDKAGITADAIAQAGKRD
jgi:DNA-binding NarL/FixJ family response regulator